jgi:hypothetical protein
MTGEDVYQIWRPASSPWVQWVKAVVFPFLSPEDLSRDEYSVPDWQVSLHPGSAIIADLPGSESVSAGITMARAGYQPVLLYNACAGAMNATSGEPPTVVDMSSILAAICATTKQLALLNLPAQAPPVFLLDANRHAFGISPEPGWFDNRSFRNVIRLTQRKLFSRTGNLENDLDSGDTRHQSGLAPGSTPAAARRYDHRQAGALGAVGTLRLHRKAAHVRDLRLALAAADARARRRYLACMLRHDSSSQQ